MQKYFIFGGAIALAGLLVTFTLLGGEPRAGGPDDLAQPESRDAEIAALQRELQTLEADLHLLRRELDQARDEGLGQRARGARAERAPGKPMIGEVDDLAPEEETRDAVIDALSSPDPEVRQRLRAVLQEEQERMHEERFDEHMARRKARSMERLNQLASQAGLGPEQVRQVAGLMDQESDKLRELFREAQRDHSFREAREQADQLRQQTDQQVEELLEEEQYQAYQTMRKEDTEGWGRGGRGRRGGGPPR